MAIKRKISEERKQQLRDQLERARAKRKPAEYKNVHPTVLALPEDDNYEDLYLPKSRQLVPQKSKEENS